MAKSVPSPKKARGEAHRYISNNAWLVGAAAFGKRTLHVSQSFGGSRDSSAVVVCFVTCPDAIGLEMQRAIDAAVLEVLAEHGCKAVTIQ
jgi:hypothetical protein